MSGIQNQFLIEFRIDAAASATYTLPRDLRIIDAAALDEVGAVLNVTLSVQGGATIAPAAGGTWALSGVQSDIATPDRLDAAAVSCAAGDVLVATLSAPSTATVTVICVPVPLAA